MAAACEAAAVRVRSRCTTITLAGRTNPSASYHLHLLECMMIAACVLQQQMFASHSVEFAVAVCVQGMPA